MLPYNKGHATPKGHSETKALDQGMKCQEYAKAARRSQGNMRPHADGSETFLTRVGATHLSLDIVSNTVHVSVYGGFY